VSSGLRCARDVAAPPVAEASSLDATLEVASAPEDTLEVDALGLEAPAKLLV
jgi:hypothetical protein